MIVSRRLVLVGTFVFGIGAYGGKANAAAPEAAATTGAVTDDLSAPNPEWRIAKGAWDYVDGAWRGAELPDEKHGAVVRRNVRFSDVVIEFDFRLDGAKGISLSINDPKGHNSRLSIRPSGFTITKDDHDHAGPDERAVLGTVEATFEPGRWYHARLEQRGEKFTAQVGDHAASGRHPAVAVEKSNIGFTVAGKHASFKQLKVLPQPATP